MSDVAQLFVDRMNSEGRGEFAELLLPIDRNCDEEAKNIDLGSLESKYSKYHIEEILRSCVERISSCISLREQAAELEIRKFHEEADRHLQMDILRERFAAERRSASTVGPLPDSYKYLSLNGDSLVDSNLTASKVREALESQERIFKSILGYYELISKKAETPGDPTRLLERYSFLKKLFVENFREAYRRAVVCKSGLKDVFGIEAPLPPTNSASFFNDLVFWAQGASDRLDEELDQRAVGEVAFSISATGEEPGLCELLKLSEWQKQRAALHLNFQLKESVFNQLGMFQPLVRACRIQAVQVENMLPGIWHAEISLPTTGRHVSVLASTESKGISEIQYSSEFLNLKPYGAWSIRFNQPHSLNHVNLDKVGNFIIYLQLSYRKA